MACEQEYLAWEQANNKVKESADKRDASKAQYEQDQLQVNTDSAAAASAYQAWLNCLVG